MATKAMLELPFEVREGGSFVLDPVGTTRIFTPEDLTREQLAISESARRLADTEILPRLPQIEAQEPGLMRELLRKAGELGLLLLDIPEKYGGMEQDKTTTMLISETLNRCASFAISVGAHVGIGSLPLVYFGTVEQKERYLPKLATGEWIAAYALTEPGSGSDALAARSRAELSADGTHYVLNGSKQWITNAGFADLFVVFAKIDGTAFTAFLVERESEGFSVGPEEHKHGIKGSSTCALSFQNVKVPVENLLGEAGQGHRIAFNILNVGRARLGIACVGAAKYALHLATRYGNEREQFGKHLTEFGLIRGKIGEMACRIFAGESLGYRTAGLIDKKYDALEELSPGPDDDDFQRSVEEYTIEASILKVFGSEVLDFVADEAMQIHGGYGYMAEYDIERVSRDARINRIFEGTNEINRLLIAGTLLKRATQQRLPLMAAVTGVEQALGEGQEPTFEPHSPWLGALQAQVQRMKGAMLFATMQAVKRYTMAIEEEQAILGSVAEMLMAVYAADSVVARALQHGEEGPHAAFFDDCATVYSEQARDRTFCLARSVLCSSLEGDKLDEALQQLALLDHWRPLDLHGIRDRIAEAVIAADGWPVK